MEELQHVFGSARIRWIYGGIEDGRNDDAVYSVCAIGGNRSLKSFEDGSKGRFSRGHDWDEGHVGDGGVSKTLGQIKGVAEGRRLFCIVVACGSRARGRSFDYEH